MLFLRYLAPDAKSRFPDAVGASLLLMAFDAHCLERLPDHAVSSAASIRAGYCLISLASRATWASDFPLVSNKFKASLLNSAVKTLFCSIVLLFHG